MAEPLAESTVVPVDDASQQYMVHAQAQTGDAMVDSFMARVRARQRPEAEAEAAKTQPAQPAAPAGRAPLKITVRPPPRGMEAAIAGVGAVAGDIAQGLFVEGAPAVVGGINDAVRNSIGAGARALSGLGDWLNENVADLRIDTPPTGSETIDSIIRNPLMAAAEALPEKLPGQKSVTGKMVREGARFITGFVPTLRAMRGVGATGQVGALGAGGLSEFFTQDPSADNLSNLIQSVPALKNPVNEFLATDPEDPAALNRLRHAIEGIGFGALTDGLVLGIRTMAHGRRAVSEMQAQRTRHGEVQEQQLRSLGDPDPNAPRVTVEEIDLGVPTDVAARGVVGSAMDADRARVISSLAPPRDAAAYVDERAYSQSLRSTYFDGETKKASSRTTPFDGELPPVGSWRISSTKGIHGRDIEQLTTVRLDKLELPEVVDGKLDPVKRGDEARYAEWIKEGRRAPPIEVVQTDAGQLKVMDGHRRVLAAKQAGHDQIEAWISYSVPHPRGLVDSNGKPMMVGLTYEIAAEAPGKGFRPPDLNFKINWARIGAPDDIDAVLGDMVTAFSGRVNEARRGVITKEAASELADNLGMTVDDLLARHRGQAFNAEQLIAAGRLFKASGEKVLETAQAAASPGASAVDQANFRRMIATHAAIQERFLGASAEAGRALQAMRQVYQGGGVEQARQIQMFLDGMGGAEATTELARRVATLGSQGAPPGALATVVRRGWGATTKDAIQEAYVLGLLWSPVTHAANNASNLAVAFQQVYERGVAAKIGDFLGSSVDARVADGEAIAMAYGLVSSLKESFALSWRALKTGEAASPGAKLDIPREPSISTGALSRELGHSPAETQAFRESPMGMAVDFMGEVTRAPGRLLLASDEFFKTAAFRAEVHAQSLRQATQEGHTGQDLWRRMAEIANDPPEHIRLAAADAALYSTFQNTPGKFAQGVMQLRNAGSLNPTFLVLPFVKTPANILRYGFERSPLAPLVGQWRDDIAAGGARRDLALARMATGTAILAVAFDMAASGQITGAGPSEPGKKEVLMRQGWQPNSIRIGDKYYSYNRSELAMILSFAGTVSEKLKSKDMSPEDFDAIEENVAHAIAAISQSVVSKTFFTGVSRLFSTIQGSERGEGGVATFLDRQTASLMPFSSLSGFVKRVTDPVQREANSPWQAIQANMAGLSTSLPPKRDVWGKEIEPDQVYGRAYDLLSPAAVSQRKVLPIDAELERLNASITRIKKKTNFAGVEVNFRDFPEVYDEYVRLAGNELRHPAWGVGAKDFLDAVVSGKHSMSSVYQSSIYTDGPDGGKASFIKNVVSDYRKQAQQQIMSEARQRFPEFADYMSAKLFERQENKMPGTGGLTLPR